MKKYTTRVHVERLKKMLRRKDLRKCCPANYRFCAGPKSRITYDFEVSRRWDLEGGSYPCDICITFLELPKDSSCPCDALGSKHAREVTEQKIKEWEEVRRNDKKRNLGRAHAYSR